MGYLLEFYTMNWDELTEVIGSGNTEVYESIVAQEGNLFVTPPAAEIDWKGALRRLLLETRGKIVKARDVRRKRVEWVGDDESLALAALVRARGVRLGELSTTSRGSKKFRAVLRSDAAKPLLNPEVRLDNLLHRPLFGLGRKGYPAWGGLDKDEILRAVGDRTLDDFPPIEDYDAEQWLYALAALLIDAKLMDKDLVTLYV